MIIRIQGTEEKRQGVHYEVDTDLPPLGVGGMGQVLRGVRVQEKTGIRMDVAIKFLFDDLPSHVIERARREASVQIHNENLVEMFGFIQIDEEEKPGIVHQRYHLISELLQGIMLFDLLNGKITDSNGTPIPFAQELYQQYMNDRYGFAIFIIKNILSGIMALHDKGYIHRDLDPSNVMITSDRKVKVIDFGIAKQMTTLTTQDRHLTTAGQFMGKAAYAAPELVTGDVRNQNETTDIYAIGIMFFQFIVGRLPFEGASHEILDMQLHVKLPLQLVPQKTICKIIEKATAKKQSERYQSAAEFRVAIEQLSRNSLEEKTVRIPFDLTVLKNKKIVGIACAMVVIIGMVGGILSWTNASKEKKMMVERQARQVELDKRKAELESEVIDSSESTYQIDSLTGCSIKTAALLTSEAMEYLKEATKAKDGLILLDKVIAKNYRSSAEALRIKGMLLYEDSSFFSPKIQLMKANAMNALTPDNIKAHLLMEQAVKLDSTSYKALYELGCDYFGGPIRTNVEDSRNVEKALQYFYDGLGLAKQVSDGEYIEKFQRRINQLNGK